MFNLSKIPEKEKEALEYLISCGYDVDINLYPEYKPTKVGERIKNMDTVWIDKTISIQKEYRIKTSEV